MVKITTFWNDDFEVNNGNDLDIIELPNTICFSIMGYDAELSVDNVDDVISVLSRWLSKKRSI